MNHYNLGESIFDSLMNYDDRKYSTTKVALFKTMINSGDTKLIWRVIINTIKNKIK